MNRPYNLKGEQIHSREIVASDLDVVAKFLTNSFRYSPEYFPELLDTLTKHPTPTGYPKYGRVLLSGNIIVGVILLIFSAIRLGSKCSIRCNVTTWSVDPAYRPYAAIFFSKALGDKVVTYLNILHLPQSLPFIKLQSFSKFTDGQFAAIPLLSRRLDEGTVQLVPPVAVSNNSNLDPFEQELLLAHANYGCISLWCITKDSAHPFVFQQYRFKGIIPGLQLVYCRDVKDFVRFARPIGLFLASRGGFFVSVNSSGPIAGLCGKYFAGVRPVYFKGPTPQMGDLAYTQAVMHRQPRRPFWRR